MKETRAKKTSQTRNPQKRGISRLLSALIMLGLCGIFITSMSADDKKAERSWTYTEKATLGGGCFWCIEAVFERFEGVKSAVSGYAGGTVPDPTYKQVCSGETGHAEVVQVEFDPKKISYAQILEIFWAAHDPTSLNRQGADVGTQYRSVIMYHNEEQKKTAEESIKAAQAHYKQPIVTQVVPLKHFYPAEDYHQDYFAHHPNQPYCAVVIGPKLRSLEKKGILPAK